jgi:hypothetical protein
MLIISSIVFALLFCSLLLSVFITQFYLNVRRQNDPSYDSYADEEAKEAGEDMTISTAYARQGLHIFFLTFLACIIGVGFMLSTYYKLPIASVLLFINYKKCIAIAICISLTYIFATTYFSKKDAAKDDEKDEAWSIWSLFRIEFTNAKQKDSMYMDDAIAFYKTVGYFWILLAILVIIV